MVADYLIFLKILFPQDIRFTIALNIKQGFISSKK
jgi:hypothetical protein